MKRIIVCLDGTWNTSSRSGPTTNVVAIRDRLVATLAEGEVGQRIYYDEGVGTANPIDKFTGGAVGFGLGQNVRQAYKYLCRHYEHGDEIYLIGFSRGSFTARSVAGYIAACGLLTHEACTTAREDEAWRYYHTMPKDRPVGDEDSLRKACHRNISIKCVAVFDTVGALGIPGALSWIGRGQFAFHDTQLSRCVENCFHAVAIDEKRMTFPATMWEWPFNFGGSFPNVEQVWFPGVHCDIGGGYAETDVSDISLGWMMNRLASLGVQFAANAMPDPGKRTPTGVMHESRTAFYTLSRIWPHDRPIDAVSPNARSNRDTRTVEYRPIAESVHRSALDRWQGTKRYRPVNLKAAMPVITEGLLPVIDWDGTPMPFEKVRDTYGAILG